MLEANYFQLLIQSKNKTRKSKDKRQEFFRLQPQKRIIFSHFTEPFCN